VKQSELHTHLTSLLAGVAGEYFVAAELSRRGYLASITLRNTKGVDILASNGNASRTVAIQVKTNKGSTSFAENHFYVLVNLNEPGGAPEYFVVPSKVIADYVKTNHAGWLAVPGKQGQARRDSSLRKFSDPDEKYLNQWELLGL